MQRVPVTIFRIEALDQHHLRITSMPDVRSTRTWLDMVPLVMPLSSSSPSVLDTMPQECHPDAH